MPMEWVGRVVEFAAAHDGVILVGEAAGLGVDRRALVGAMHHGIVRRAHRDVFALAGPPLGHRGRARAATLQSPEAVASHESALRLGGVDRVPDMVAVTVCRPSAGHTLDGVRVHRVQDLIDEHVTIIGGIRSTTIERAVVDVASVFSTPRLRDLLDRTTITRRMTTVGKVARVDRQVNRRGRAGIATLALVLDERSPGEPEPRSTLERRVDALFEDAGLPSPLREYPLPSGSGFRGIVDRAWPEALVILEIDGRSWHAREAAMASDRARDRRAARAGWLTLRVLGDEVRECPELVVDDVVSAYQMRLAQLQRRSA
jgi:hypothetical protein